MNKNNQIPEFTNLNEIYFDDALIRQGDRYIKLQNDFETYFKCKPTFISRAPGRVNLIGEHVDYAGFSVIPMAIENDALFVVSTYKSKSNNPTIEVTHELPNQFKGQIFNLNNMEELKFITPHSWLNYFIAGFNCINDYLSENYKQKFNEIYHNTSINILITGNVPMGSGLSSSSCMTVGAALATLKAYDCIWNIDKYQLADITINYERKVGTACGGMDQTICICGEKNIAKKIDFIPDIQVHDVRLPSNVTFVISNSLTPSFKIDTLPYRYNKRVVENKLGLEIISKKMYLENNSQNEQDYKLNKYKILIDLVIDLKLETLEPLSDLIKKYLKKEDYTLDEIKTYLKIDDFSTILNHVPYWEDVIKKNNEYSLYKRLLHVAEESIRVNNFKKTCEYYSNNNENDKVDLNEFAKKLGDLMNQSHESCRDLYDCSSVQLDDLAKFCISKGALGSRLTGAGWGGCSVSVVKNDNIDYFMKELEGYYSKAKTDLKPEEIYFPTKPGQGAGIFLISEKV